MGVPHLSPATGLRTRQVPSTTWGRKNVYKPLRPLFAHRRYTGEHRNRGGTLDLKDNHIFVMTDASGFFCIGASRNPEKKARELRKANPTIRLVATRRMSHGSAYRWRDRYHKLYAHRRITGEWLSLPSRELGKMLDDLDSEVIPGAIGREMDKLKPSIEKRDRNGLERAFREKFDSAYPAMLRPLLMGLQDRE